ncbi:transcription termination factor MTERF5, chloroplastic isoform X2 [Phalaenopsis equestris]|uniref:transcription termination factor MTERF5, chloroplastic isoform X2 n=1 Tax=Phalaenopsis equestris TaxID=78828 RepID=UPI0009E30DE6|nr:transcription termination factor MTERF5, chloroplastic isoform X2 [Phalaenopsis equestris]
MAFLANFQFEFKIMETMEKNPLFNASGETGYWKKTQQFRSPVRRANSRSDVSSITRLLRVSTISISRVRIRSSQACLACKAKTYESEADDHSLVAVPFNLLAAEREEAKAVLSLFLRKQGFSNAVALRIVKKSDLFIDHLMSKLQSFYKSWFLVGRELTTIEIRNALIPYLESLHEENGDLFVDLVVSYPNPPGWEKANPVSLTASYSLGKKERAVARVSQENADGLLPANVLYLMDLGLKLEQIKGIVSRFPAFAYYTLDQKIKPLVEFLLELGMDKSDIPTILHKRPQLCGISLSEKLKPMMTYLESYGVDKTKWAKVIYRFPALLTYSKQKVKASVDFLSEIGVPEKNIGKILTRCPHITSYSVEEKLRPTAEYFLSLNIDPASLIYRCPQTFGLSIDGNLRPVNEFFLERGYSVQEIATMVLRYGALYTFSLSDNIIPKWNYFLTMDYPRSELVKFPHYFGYSLNERIKPRHFRMKECNVRLILNQMLSSSNSEFEKVVEKRMCKLPGSFGSTKACSGQSLRLEECSPLFCSPNQQELLSRTHLKLAISSAVHHSF